MQSRWNSQILPRAETATSHVAFSEELDALRSFIKLLSSDNITEKHKKEIDFNDKSLITQWKNNYIENIILLIKGLKFGVPNSAKIRIPLAAS